MKRSPTEEGSRTDKPTQDTQAEAKAPSTQKTRAYWAPKHLLMPQNPHNNNKSKKSKEHKTKENYTKASKNCMQCGTASKNSSYGSQTQYTKVPTKTL